MTEFYRLAGQFMDVRRSLSYIKFDKELSRKVKHEVSILGYLQLHGGIAYPKELSEEFAVSTAQMAVLLNQLEEKAYIARIPDRENRRRTIVKLCPEGLSFFEDKNREILNFLSRFFRELGLEDSRELVRLYKKMMQFRPESEPESCKR